MKKKKIMARLEPLCRDLMYLTGTFITLRRGYLQYLTGTFSTLQGPSVPYRDLQYLTGTFSTL
jgi:hypothetical protein